MEVTVQHKTEDSRGTFFVEHDGKVAAKMTYSRAGASKFIIDHTEVSKTLGGQGVGYKLVEAAVEYARAEDQRIVTVCPFARAVFEKTPEYEDVWDK